MKSYRGNRRRETSDGEFLWLISLSDLMMLLFVFFVVLFSFSYKKLSNADLFNIQSSMSGERGKSIDEIQLQLTKWAVDKNLLKDVSIRKKEDSLVLEIQENILFAPGEWQVSEEAVRMIQDLKLALNQIPSPYRLGIEGHTDNLPVRGGDNWLLSVKRAHSVLLALNLPKELQARTVLMGFADTRPSDSANIDKNRRVSLRIF